MAEANMDGIGTGLTVVLLLVFTALSLFKALQVVPQSERWTVERFGRYIRTLDAGLNVLIPWLDKVSERVSVLERALEQATISVITKDNVEVEAETTVFFRIEQPEKAVYRIRNPEEAITTMATSVVRSAAGKLELDAIQGSRQAMNEEIAMSMGDAAEEWGIQITRTEITDIIVDQETREAQRKQLNAARERRATIERAEGERQAVQLTADGELYAAKQAAEGIKVTADAKAYAIEREAKAQALQTEVVGKAICGEGGQEAVGFEVRRLQVQAMETLGQGTGTRTLIMPTDVVGVLGAVETLAQGIGQAKKGA